MSRFHWVLGQSRAFMGFRSCSPKGGHPAPCNCPGMRNRCSEPISESIARSSPGSLPSPVHRGFQGALLVTAIVASSLVPATGASAQWGAPEPQRDCSSSVGCYVDPATGRAVYTTLGPTLTARERDLLGQCQLRMAGSGAALAGGLAGRNWLAILGAAFNGGAALAGPCKDLWNSTARYRRS